MRPQSRRSRRASREPRDTRDTRDTRETRETRETRKSPSLDDALRSAPAPRIAIAAGTTAILLTVLFTASPSVLGFLDFGAGVLTLVSLTSTCIWGVLSTDTKFLGASQRLLTQGVHRGLAISALCFLVLHVSVKVTLGHVTLLTALVPFVGAPGRNFLVGLGVVAAYLLIFAAVTGAMRSVFAEKRHPVRWRILHSSAYVSWCAALVHGLNAGRPAASWVTISYVLALIGVAISIIVRLRKVGDEPLMPSRRTQVPIQRRAEFQTALSAPPVPPSLPPRQPAPQLPFNGVPDPTTMQLPQALPSADGAYTGGNYGGGGGDTYSGGTYAEPPVWGTGQQPVFDPNALGAGDDRFRTPEWQGPR